MVEAVFVKSLRLQVTEPFLIVTPLPSLGPRVSAAALEG